MNTRKYEKKNYSSPKYDAQLNLEGRTHYVDDDTLKFHKAKILTTYNTDNGLLFALIESVALDYENKNRGFRYVIFDICGHVISRVDLENAFKSKASAIKAMWKALNEIDAKAVTLLAIDREKIAFARQVEELTAMVA